MGKNEIITLDSKVIRNNKKFITSPIGDELVMMSMESGSYIGINEVGVVIWNRIDQPTLVKDIVTYLSDIYDISEQECAEKTIKHLNDMAAEDMITIL